MKKLIFSISLFICLNSYGNIHFINFDNIPEYQNYSEQFDFLIQNVQYYNHWQPDWDYDVSKKSLVKNLKKFYLTFSELDKENAEIQLLLGDISHYLYNLHEEDYFEKAEEHYLTAIELASKDYRTHWFLANHYALSNILDKSIEQYFLSQEILPDNAPAEYWEEYAFATAVANMPTNCIYAMDKAKAIIGEPTHFETQLGKTIYDRIKPMDRDSEYSYMDLWSVSPGKMLMLTSRPLGLKLIVDSTWQTQLYDYQNYQSFITIVPPAIANNEGREITYTIAIIMKVITTDESLDGFIDKFISRYPIKNEYNFSTKYSDLISFELKDQNMYEDMGGAHMHMIGISRKKPKYAGMLLEQPMKLPEDNEDGLKFYEAGESKDRFDGLIYYAVMLDACEDIYSEAYRVFSELFENELIIE